MVKDTPFSSTTSPLNPLPTLKKTSPFFFKKPGSFDTNTHLIHPEYSPNCPCCPSPTEELYLIVSQSHRESGLLSKIPIYFCCPNIFFNILRHTTAHNSSSLFFPAAHYSTQRHTTAHRSTLQHTSHPISFFSNNTSQKKNKNKIKYYLLCSLLQEKREEEGKKKRKKNKRDKNKKEHCSLSSQKKK